MSNCAEPWPHEVGCRMMTRSAVNYGEVRVLVHVQPKIGTTYKFDGASPTATPVIQWCAVLAAISARDWCRSGEEASFPLQAVVRGAALHLQDQQSETNVPLDALFLPGAPCCLLTTNYYGCMGKVGGL